MNGDVNNRKSVAVSDQKRELGMQWKIEVGYKPTATDAAGGGIKKDIEDLGISGVDCVRTLQMYVIDGDISESEVKTICENLLADRITQLYEYKCSLLRQDDAGALTEEFL